MLIMERRGLAFGNAMMDLIARFPVPRWGGIARRLNWSDPARIWIQTSGLFSLGYIYGSHLYPHSGFFVGSTVAYISIPHNALVLASQLVFLVGHPDPWVVRFLETEIASFAYQAALAARRLASRGFDMVAYICFYYYCPALEWTEEINEVEEGIQGWEEELGDDDPATSSEVEQLETVNYGQDRDIHGGRCPICMEDYGPEIELKRMRCHHVYHRHCLLQWLEAKRICPVCRTTIAERAEDEDRP